MKKPQIFVDGKRAKIVPECSNCGLTAEGLVAEEEQPPDGWEYNGYYGWLCPECRNDYKE